ncbi:MAG: DUF2207 domain-containing protein [Oscillospiraceae bacterium]
MKKLTLSVLLLFALMLPAQAANRVDSIAVQGTIMQDGSMYVVQNWDGSFHEGTENYIVMNAPPYLTISDLKVTDKGGTYQTVPDWNLDWSMAEKAGKCGIHPTDTGYEICFGISDYGENRYAIEYKLENVVAGYTDVDGVNFRFVSDGMNTTPTDVTVELHLWDGTPITDEMADVWGFGFDGQVEFRNGALFAYTETPLTDRDHVTLLFNFQKGVLTPSRVVDDSFETVKQEAFRGSDYDSDSRNAGPILVVVAVFFALIIAAVLAVVLSKRNREKKLKQFSERFGYFREIPNDGNLTATYSLGRLFALCDESAIMGAGLLRLIDLGCLAPVSEEETGFFGKTKETISLRLAGSNHAAMDEFDEYLYSVLEAAAGPDGVLQERELEKFAEKNDTLLRNYIRRCEEAGRAYLTRKDAFTRWSSPSKLQYLTESGEQELGELMGFKRYLEDFSLIDERGVQEMPIWREMLSYAMLFGIADRVSAQLAELYPSMLPELTIYNQRIYAAGSYQMLLYHNMRNAEMAREQEKRSGGSGGFASMGGGGGSMGGGSGGGSR